MTELLTEFLSVLLDPNTSIGAALAFAAMGTINYFFGAIPGLGMPRRRYRPPVTKGQIHLFDDDGEGHFLSAKMSTAGLEQLLQDLNRRRFG